MDMRSRLKLSEALSACRSAFAAVGSFTAVINVLGLTGSIFMLQVYDRVLPSRSVPTLLALVSILIAVFAIQGGLEAIRMRLMVRIGRSLDQKLTQKTYRSIAQVPTRQQSGDGLQSVRDLDQIRGFLSSVGPTALFDLPWMPLYIGVCFLFHFWIGMTALIGAIILVALTAATELLSRTPSKDASVAGARRLVFAEATRRNAEVIQAMGMTPQLSRTWQDINTRYMNFQQNGSDIAGGLGSASRVLRLLMQSLVLAVGAYLVMIQEASGGIIIASSILFARALAPVEIAIAHWRGFLAARQSWGRLSELLAGPDTSSEQTALPAPRSTLSVENLTVATPGQQKIVVQDVTFKLAAGQAVGIIGPSASGKSSLARSIVGIWKPARGRVRLDGAALDQWDSDDLGRHIGYLPQDVELFAGTIAQNISRFQRDVESSDVIAAAKVAGINELILRLPQGYDTEIGDFGNALSAGQRQRVALARAMFGNPFLIVLDEPNSNLDSEGDDALTKAIVAVTARGGIAIVVAHRPSALAGVDTILAMSNGRLQAFGPKEDIMKKFLDAARPAARAVKALSATPGH